MQFSKIILILTVASLLVLAYVFDVQSYLNLETLRANYAELVAWKDDNLITAVTAAMVIYILVTALSIPGAAVMTLAVGAIFGFWHGLVIASFASTIGATLAFLAARFLLRDWVQSKFSNRFTQIDERFAKDGAFYLLSLRLVPLFPFFMINLLMGLTRIRTFTYFWVSQLGMLAGTAVFVNAGTQLATIQSLGDVFSLQLVLSFTLLGIFPLIAKVIVNVLQRRKRLKNWQKPKVFDRNLIVIGGGSAGLVSAYIAATVKAKVTLIEQHKMGGDCLNTGCVPSKTLINIARKHAALNKANGTSEPIQLSNAMAKVEQVIKDIEPHDSVERYTNLGVEVLQGHATITSPWQVEITTNAGTQTLTTRSIIVATGAKPFVPPIPGLHDIPYRTSDSVWELEQLPPRLLVLGGGPIGCELATAFANLGSKVTVLEAEQRLLSKEDEDAAAMVTDSMQQQGVQIVTGKKAVRFAQEGGESLVYVEGEEQPLRTDCVLVAVGRAANLSGFGLAELGVETERTLPVNALMQTEIPSIYAAGDVAGPYQFTHVAAHQAWYASVNALFAPLKSFAADYRVIPRATFTDPEVAAVGLNELEAKAQHIHYEVTRYDMSDLDRAIADDVAYGFVKVLTKPGKDEILGVTIVGARASEQISEFVLAMKYKLGLNKILGTIHIYPTMSEANKYVAGEWRKAHKPERALAWLEKFHAWRRG